MRTTTLRLPTKFGAALLALTLLLTVCSRAVAPRGDPEVVVRFLGHTNETAGIGVNRFSISNASPFQVLRGTCLYVCDTKEHRLPVWQKRRDAAPLQADGGIAAGHRVLAPHETELMEVEDLASETLPPEGPRWKLIVSCVTIQRESRNFIVEVTKSMRDHGLPAPRLKESGEVLFLSDWVEH